MKLKTIWTAYKRERIESRLMNVNGIQWYIENDDKIDEIQDLLYPIEE